MPQNTAPTNLKSAFKKRPPGFGADWRKRLLILMAVIGVFFIAGHFGVRFILWPQIEKSKASVEKLIGARAGVNVAINDLKVSWTGIRPAFEIDGLRFLSPNNTQEVLSIKKIYGEISWKSFYHLAPYFHEIYIEDAQIQAQRSAKGIITIAGITLDGGSNDYTAENWLFSQDLIDIKNVNIVWDDEQSKKLPSNIEVQKLSLENGIRKHRGALIAVTPWNKGPLEVNVDFVHHIGGQPGNWRDWIGNLSWNLTALDLNQIAKEFKLKLYSLEGILSSNGNLKIDNAKPDGGEFFVAVDKLVVQLSKSEDAIALGRLETNLLQETEDGLITISTKSFSWRDMDSPKSAPLEKLSPMTFRWRPPGPDGEIKEFGFSSPKILVEDVALFALNLPLSKKVHQWIKTSKAEGELEDLDIHWSESKSPLSALNIPGGWFKSNKLDFSVSAKLINLSFVGINKSIPSVSNLSGFISSTHKEGSFSLKSNNLGLEVYDLLEDPKIQLDKASGQIKWAKQKGRWVIDAKKVALSNPEITTNLNLNYIVGNPKEADTMSLDMEFEKANLKTAYRYLPLGMSKEVRTYLSKAFEAGTIQNGRLHIKGDPNEVPFADAQKGEFNLDLPITGAAFSPVPGLPKAQGTWSTFNNVNGKVAMNHANFTVDIDKATYKQVALDAFHAEIPNVSAKQLILTVNGHANGEASQFLEYFYASPAGKAQDQLEQHLRVTGPLEMNLGLKIPLTDSSDTNVDVKLSLPGNRAEWSGIPPFENLKGNIRITENNPEFEDITANFLGGAIKITSTDQGKNKQNFSIAGDIKTQFLKEYFAKSAHAEIRPLLNAMNGSIAYEGAVNFNKLGSNTNLRFDLKNWSLNAPAPASKLAGSPLTAEVNIKTYAKDKSNPNRASWSGKMGDLYSLQGVIGRDDVISHSVGIGAPPNMPKQGFNLNLASNELNLDAWQDFLNVKGSAQTTVDESHPNPIQLTAQIKKLIAFDRAWPDVNAVANYKKNIMDLRLSSPMIAGQLQYQAAHASYSNGLISGHLTKLKLPEVTSDTTTAAIPKNNPLTAKSLNPEMIPSLDITIDDFLWSKANFGQVKIKTSTEDNVLKIDSIQTSNPQGATTLKGQWRGGDKNNEDRSSLTIAMDIKDAGLIITNWAAQNAVEGGSGKINADVEWNGPPFNPKLETLSGTASLNLENGRFLNVNSSGAKILDILSLQSLLKFATLDLQGSLGNIVTKGTPFNTITSNFDINQGIAQTKQFNMNLDQARVAMTGQINVFKQTQDLRITIFPTIDATAGSLAAFAINPIVGLSALIGQYLVTSQINRGMQSDYLVQGSWDNPEVIPLDQKGQPLDAKTLNTIRSKELLKEQDKPSLQNTPNIPSKSTN